MSDVSTIEWTDATWNPVTGCTPVSPGCDHCYAARMAHRLQAMGQAKYQTGFQVACHHDVLDEPERWRKPRMVFVCSMGDLFHKDVPFGFISTVFNVMARADRHTFQVLTKRSDRLRSVASMLPWPENVWMGVTIESAAYMLRADRLRHADASVRFISLEPLLGPIPHLRLYGIDWVIVGGESGPHARPMRVEWVREIRDQCVERGVPFFFKQWGGVHKKRNGRLLDGREWNEMPRREEARGK